jgi:regulatory protein
MPKLLLADKSMEEKELLESLRQKCYRFLSTRERSEKEIREYLRKKVGKFKLDNPERLISLLVHQLKEDGLIDDKKFIAWWVEQRSYFKPKGFFALKQELLQKGINRELIDQYFEENQIDELELAKIALQKKAKVLKGLEKEEFYQRAISFLLRRGFSYEVAQKALRSVFESSR